MIDIAEAVREVVAFHLGPGKAAMTEDATLAELGADSIDLYGVVMSLEEKFDINIDDRDAQRLVNLDGSTEGGPAQAELSTTRLRYVLAAQHAMHRAYPYAQPRPMQIGAHEVWDRAKIDSAFSLL